MMGMPTALALLAAATILWVIGRPDKEGNPARFLRFNTAPVLFPPLVLALLAVGCASLISSVSAH